MTTGICGRRHKHKIKVESFNTPASTTCTPIGSSQCDGASEVDHQVSLKNSKPDQQSPWYWSFVASTVEEFPLLSSTLHFVLLAAENFSSPPTFPSKNKILVTNSSSCPDSSQQTPRSLMEGLLYFLLQGRWFTRLSIWFFPVKKTQVERIKVEEGKTNFTFSLSGCLDISVMCVCLFVCLHFELFLWKVCSVLLPVQVDSLLWFSTQPFIISTTICFVILWEKSLRNHIRETTMAVKGERT